MKHATRLLSTIALVWATFVSSAAADTVRLAGSPAVIAAVIDPHRAAVERATGHTLQVMASETGPGLVALANRKADIAMVSERIDHAVAAAARAGKQIPPSALWLHELQLAGGMTRKLSLVTVGAPPAEVARVIDAFKRAAAGQLGQETMLVAR